MRPIQRARAGDEDIEPGGVRGEARIDERGRELQRRPTLPSMTSTLLISKSRAAPLSCAWMAERLSEVTSQLAATRKSLAIALGRQTAMFPLAWTAPASPGVAALSSPANLSTSARPYCSIARTAILCAA